MSKSPITKRYFHTQDTEFTLPPEFISSRNKRYFIFRYCAAEVYGVLIGNYRLHCDIVEKDPYCDHFVMLTNHTQTDYAKYEFTNPYKKTFKIWFTDLHNNVVKPDIFQLSCLLIY